MENLALQMLMGPSDFKLPIIGASNATTSSTNPSARGTYEAAIPTSAVTVIETEHGRLRRKQRAISKRDLQSARKHGGKCSAALT
jgi:hypothetical protein